VSPLQRRSLVEHTYASLYEISVGADQQPEIVELIARAVDFFE